VGRHEYVKEIQLLCGDLPFEYTYDCMRWSLCSQMKGKNKNLDCLLALNNTFENYMIETYQPVSLSKHKMKNAVRLYFDSSLCFDV